MQDLQPHAMGEVTDRKVDSMFVQRAIYFPATGKGPDVRALLETLTLSEQTQGVPVSLAAAAFRPDGPAFVRTIRLDNLNALERRRSRAAADPARLAFNAKLSPLLRQDAMTELYEIII